MKILNYHMVREDEDPLHLIDGYGQIIRLLIPEHAYITYHQDFRKLEFEDDEDLVWRVSMYGEDGTAEHGKYRYARYSPIELSDKDAMIIVEKGSEWKAAQEAHLETIKPILEIARSERKEPPIQPYVDLEKYAVYPAIRGCPISDRTLVNVTLYKPSSAIFSYDTQSMNYEFKDELYDIKKFKALFREKIGQRPNLKYKKLSNEQIGRSELDEILMTGHDMNRAKSEFIQSLGGLYLRLRGK